METTLEAPKFSPKERAYWASASFGGALINGIYAALINIFYNDYLGLSSEGIVVLYIQIIFLLVNAFNDPIFGIVSDRTRARKGRRIPFMRYTAPFLGLTFVLIWFSPDITSGVWVVFIWMVITTCLYDTAYTIIFLVYSALLPEITEDEPERNKLKVFASFFNLIGMILGFIIPDLFRNFSRPLLLISMIVVGIIGSIAIIITTYKFKERPEFTKLDEPLGLVEALKYTFKSKSFLILVAANFLVIFFQSSILSAVFWIADYVTQSSSLILLVFIFIPLLIGIWFTPRLAKKWGVVRSNQILLIIGGISLVAGFFLSYLVVELLYICMFIAGIGFVGPLIFNDLLFAQTIDEDELNSGVRREAAFFGINALFTKPAQSLAIVIPSLLLDWTGFIPREEFQPPNLSQPFEAFLAIRLFTLLIPGLALIFSSLILQKYPIRGEYWDSIQKQILILHDKKHKKLQEMERG
ncbi:MAG: MFS transporter [Promethearchaeota archaeon]|nr:MAG: MFS transporter [Candidatus Lokiarchaeota archaeon]